MINNYISKGGIVMKDLVIVFRNIGMGCIVVALLVLCTLLAVSEYSRHNANSDYTEYRKETSPYEIALAGIMSGFFLFLLFNCLVNNFEVLNSGTLSLVAFGLLFFVFIFLISYGIVHTGCIWLSKKFPRLHELSWLQ